MGCRKGSQLPTLVQNANVGKFDAMVDIGNVLVVGLQLRNPRKTNVHIASQMVGYAIKQSRGVEIALKGN